MNYSVIELAQKLISIPSISPKDLGCQEILIQRLRALDFVIHIINVDDTKNFWAVRGSGKTLTFAGHTDVVEPGNYTKWNSNPFNPIIDNGFLFGRGAVDMKGALAAMVIAAECFVTQFPNHKGRLSFLITSDEESTAENGTIKVIEYLISNKEKIDYCIIGEPSSNAIVGDTIKNGRRGSITANLIIHGTQGHIAYPEFSNNPIHHGLPVILKILSIEFDKGNAFFSPTIINISNIHAGNGSNNITPDTLSVIFNIRFSTEVSATDIQEKVKYVLDQEKINYTIEWFLSGQPFITKKGCLLETVVESIFSFNQVKPILSTAGGTSDGRFITLIGAEIVELGLVNDTIHKINECVKIADLYLLTSMYQDIMKRLLL